MVMVVLAGVLGGAAWVWRRPLLRAAADAWIVSDQPAPADAVAVFGGGLEDRPFAAAEYYRQGLTRKILVSGVRESPAQKLGVIMPETAANRAVLVELGVPESAIETFGANLRNTHEEVLALLAWARQNGAHSLIVPSEIFSARRVSWMLHHAFPGDVAIRVPAVDPIDYDRDNWWKDDVGVVTFQGEIIKYLYYRLKY